MHKVTFPSATAVVEGAVELRETPSGTRPSRLPSWALPLVPSPDFALIADVATGVRIRTRTTATRLELRVSVTQAEVPFDGLLPATFDLRVDGQHVQRTEAEGGAVMALSTGEYRPGRLSTVRFEGLSSAAKEVEIWLPQSALCDLVSLSSDEQLQRPASGGPRWVHYGSSVSQAVTADGPLRTWTAVAATGADVDLTCLAYAGNAMLDPFVARTIRDLPADFVSLEIGANIVEQATMRTRTFGPAVDGFVDLIRDRHPDIPLLLISPIPTTLGEDAPGPYVSGGPVHGLSTSGTAADVAAGALTMRVVRETLAGIASRRAAAGERIDHLDGRELLTEQELDDLPDGLHPNASANLRIGDRFTPILADQLRSSS